MRSPLNAHSLLARHAPAHQQILLRHNSSPTDGLPSGLAVRQELAQRRLIGEIRDGLYRLYVEAQMMAHDIFEDLPSTNVRMGFPRFCQ